MADIRAATLLRDAYHYTPLALLLRCCGAASGFKAMLCQLITGEHTYATYLRQLGPLRHVLRFWAARGRKARHAATA